MELQQRYVERLQKCKMRICGRQETGIADKYPRIWLVPRGGTRYEDICTD